MLKAINRLTDKINGITPQSDNEKTKRYYVVGDVIVKIFQKAKAGPLYIFVTFSDKALNMIDAKVGDRVQLIASENCKRLIVAKIPDDAGGWQLCERGDVGARVAVSGEKIGIPFESVRAPFSARFVDFDESLVIDIEPATGFELEH